MARPAASPAIRLRALEQAMERARKLPHKTVLTSKPMAELLGVTWNTLRDQWCNGLPAMESAGVFNRGGNGVEWEFKPVATVQWLIKHYEGVRKAQATRSQKVRKAVGVSVAPEEVSASFTETKQMVDLTLAVVAAKEKQASYVPAAEMIDFISGYNQQVTSAILGVRTKVDPNGNLPPDLRRKVDDYLRCVATHVHAEAEGFIEKHNARLQQTGTG